MRIKKYIIGALASVAALSLVACGGNAGGEQTGGDVNEPPACEHVLTKIAHKDSTCAEQGHIAHYACGECGKLFFDKAAVIELSSSNIALAKVDHSIEHYAATDKVPEYWSCFACGKYFTDAALTAETTYAALYADYYNPVKCDNGAGASLNMYNSTLGTGDREPITGDFTFRCFISWKNADGLTFADFPSNKKVQVNINLNREGAGSRVDWYSFGVGYTTGTGLAYKNFEAGDFVPAPRDLNALFLEQGGIYTVTVREGSTVSFYFEDADGNRRLMSTGTKFGATEKLVRLAANQAEGAEGWTQNISDAAICIGIADPKCVFDKAYAAD